MGLDISHQQLTLVPVNKNDFYTIDDWDLDCNVSLKHYSKYITTIDDLDFDKTIAVVKCEADYEVLKKAEWIGETEFLKVFIGQPDNKMKEQFEKFIVSQKLDKLEPLQLGCEHDGIKYHTISFGEPIKVQGMYYIDDVGYQRKGMSSKFYDIFGKYMLWGEKSDFDLAYTFVKDEWYIDKEGQSIPIGAKKDFKENFIDKFEFGKSLLCVSF